MESLTPIEVIAEQAQIARRTKALAIIERWRPMSILGQQIELWFACAMILLGVYKSLNEPTTAFLPVGLIVPLLLAVAAIAGNAIITQRRLEALILLVKQDIKKY